MGDAFGLNREDIQSIISILEKESTIEEAIIFGSRAKGNYKKGSDVDIALKGRNVNHLIINRVSFYLNEETQMPYKFDLIDKTTINNLALSEHIDRVGIPIYLRK